MREDTVQNPIASIQAPVADGIVRPAGYVGSAMESSPDTKVTWIIRTVVDRSFTVTFQSDASSMAMDKAVQNYAVSHHIVNAFATCKINAPAITVQCI